MPLWVDLLREQLTDRVCVSQGSLLLLLLRQLLQMLKLLKLDLAISERAR